MPGKRSRITNFATIDSDSDEDGDTNSFVELWLKFKRDCGVRPPIKFVHFRRFKTKLIKAPRPYVTAARYVKEAKGIMSGSSGAASKTTTASSKTKKKVTKADSDSEEGHGNQ